MTGYPYTWERGFGSDAWIEVRLDRASVNNAFLNMFKDVRLINLEITTSDHCPLLLDPSVRVQLQSTKSFHFENAWMREPMCEHIVKESWQECTRISLSDKLSFCAGKLAVWGNTITGCFRDRIK